jgi:hydroxymethylpyrimidine/phosphomethylpyrimidine kinase
MPDSNPLYRLDHLPLCTIAGSDPTGGAGLQGDLRTFAAHGGHGSAVVTALTVQDRDGAHHVAGASAALVRAQVEAVQRSVRPAAWKTGMLATAAVVEAVATAFDESPPSALVVDPVLAAGAGGVLLEEQAVGLLARRLAPHATVLTPNLPEAARLLDRPEIAPGEEDDAGRALVEAGWKAVLLKGGHAEGPRVVDRLVTREGIERLEAPRLDGATVHGTGCAVSAALAARLGRGEPMERAVAGAVDYVRRAIALAHERGEWLLPHLAVRPL